MIDYPTRVLGATLALGDNPDSIQLDVRDGSLVLVLDHISVVLNAAGQDAIDKLATVTAEAAAVNWSRNLREVA
ncbi:hypothetical protein ACFVAF_25605 [Streptomyces sp. NPDC057596]|uniref:hypothetical protein n=1 Tax=Streptomyces sp. NPDC057596 TaxID=3346178 RepID=UPI00367DA946